jgi:acetyl esterase/lipase
MAESAACAIRFARAQASQLGSDDPVVVLTGPSGGGGVAAHVALFGATLEASWDEYAAEGGPPHQVDCEVTEGSTHVDALVGMAGIYDVFVPVYDGHYGRAYQQERDPEQWSFLSSSIGANPDLKIRLLHGESDGDIPYENSVEFAAMLTDAGYDVGEVIAFDGGHWVPTELVIPTVMELVGP